MLRRFEPAGITTHPAAREAPVCVGFRSFLEAPLVLIAVATFVTVALAACDRASESESPAGMVDTEPRSHIEIQPHPSPSDRTRQEQLYPHPAHEASLALLSFNVRLASAPDGPDNWEHRKEMVFDIVREVDPDIFGLQEPEQCQLEEFEAQFGEYEHVGVASEDGKSAGKFNPVFYRRERFELLRSGTFWLSEDPDEPGSTAWGAALPRICTWAALRDKLTNQTIRVYNTHLDYRTLEARERSVELIVDGLAAPSDPGPAFLLGDFNAAPTNPALIPLSASPRERSEPEDPRHPTPYDAVERTDPRPMVDTFSVRYPQKTSKEEAGTFHGFTGEPRTVKIDYIFAPEGLGVKRAGIIRTHRDGRYPSDHFPVYGTVMLPHRRIP